MDPSKDNNSTPETDLWLLFRKGDKRAFSRLYEESYQKLYSYGIHLGMDESQVSDAIQDIFLKLYEKPEIVTQPATLLPFLFRSVRNYFLNILKKENTQVDINDYITSFSFGYTIDEHLIAEEDEMTLRNRVDEVLSCLTVRQKEIIYLRFLHEMSYEEIAQVMNITQQSARNTLYKTFEKIRKNYPQYLPLLLGIARHGLF